MKTYAVLACLFAALPAIAQKRAAVGEKVPEFSFPKFLNGDGRQSLSEFHGQPILLDFWGTR